MAPNPSLGAHSEWGHGQKIATYCSPHGHVDARGDHPNSPGNCDLWAVERPAWADGVVGLGNADNRVCTLNPRHAAYPWDEAKGCAEGLERQTAP